MGVPAPSTRRPPFFERPYPDPPILYNDLPQAVRDQWVAWAQVNRVGAVDYRFELRSAPDAYLNIVTQDMLANAGDTTIYFPPEWNAPPYRTVNGLLASASVDDHIAFQLSETLTKPLTILVWGSPTNAVKADVPIQANKFLGSYTFPTGSLPGATSGDFGPAFVTAIGSLATKFDEWICLWVFECTNGNVRYSAGYTRQVNNVSFLATQAYWPLNEQLDPRRSIAIPADLTDIGNVPVSSGLIDNAIRLATPGPQYLQLASQERFSPNGSDWSVAFWIQFQNVGSDQMLVCKGEDFTTPDFEWAVTYSNAAAKFQVHVFNGTTVTTVSAALPSPAATGTWYHVVARSSPFDNRVVIFVNGAQQGVAVASVTPPPTISPLSIGNNNGNGMQARADLCELTFLLRTLSDAEIAALYNSGAGLRWPYG